MVEEKTTLTEETKIKRQKQQKPREEISKEVVEELAKEEKMSGEVGEAEVEVKEVAEAKEAQEGKEKAKEVEEVNAAKEEASGKKWYVVYVLPGEEVRVMQNLEEHIKREKLEDKFGKIVVPTEEVVELKGGQKRKSERRIFPGYVLVQMIMDEYTWHFIKNTNKVRGFVGGTREKPAPLSDREVNEIFQQVQEGAEKPRPKILFAAGEVVRIIEGPFADFDGVVEDVNYEKNKLKVSVLIFGRSTPVELDFSQVQKA